MIFNMTGGDLRLNCKVIVSAAEPGSPKVNMIWVKADIALNVVAIQPTQPTGAVNLVKGNVWIKDAASTWTSPNLNFTTSKKVGMRFFPGRTYQYDGSSWVAKDAYIWQGGQWVQFSSAFFATIAVTYPSGSTLTCTDGTTTLTATTTAGSYTFDVPNSGTWTIKAVSGSQSASKSVSITTDGQSASVTLTYNVTLVNSSGQLQKSQKTKQFSDNSYPPSFTFAQNTSSWRINVTGDDNYGGYGAVYFEGIDLTNYKTITLEISATGAGDPYQMLVWKSIGNLYTDNRVAGAAISTTGSKTTVTLDVSSLSGSHCVGIVPHIVGGGTCDVYRWTID